MNPDFVTGFSDAESSFIIGISKHPTCKTGWNVTPTFAICLHYKDLALLKRIQSFFLVGNIVINKTKGTVRFSVNSIKDIINVIIPHFMQYQLLSKKKADFELFKLVAEAVNRKEHLTTEGLHKIISIRASMNRGLTEVLKKAFPNVTPCLRPKVELPKNIDPFWFVGFVEGEGCFEVKINNPTEYKPSGQILLRFTLTQHSRDSLLMNIFTQSLGCGRLNKVSNLARLVVTKFSDIQLKIIPFFAKYSLQGSKRQDYHGSYAK